MATLYVTEQGARITRESRRLLVVHQDCTVADIPIIKLDRILIFGYAQITTQALELLLNEGIPTIFLSLQGRLKGTLEPIRSKNVPLRIAQYERARDPTFCLNVAKTIVTGKVRNQIRLVQRFAHNHPQEDFTGAQSDLHRLLGDIQRKTTIGGLLGIEGQATAVYFDVFRRILKHPSFQRRERRPPPDPVNSLLSLGYTLLAQEYFTAVSAVGLDPYLGFLHQVSYGRPSLALDLCEELRHPFVDMMTLDLFNRGMIKDEDFNSEPSGFILKPDARKKYFAKYERRMTIIFRHPHTRQNTNMRQIIHIQALKIARLIKEGGEYEPYFIG
ncbi:MAG: CRISPR-associated endonuclease Cas1 [candidate division WOR-3 bacterium]